MVDNEDIPKDKALAKAVRSMSANMELSEGKLWKKKDGRLLEVLETAERIKGVLLMLHEGIDHKALGSVYTVFAQRFWVPAASITHRTAYPGLPFLPGILF